MAKNAIRYAGAKGYRPVTGNYENNFHCWLFTGVLEFSYQKLIKTLAKNFRPKSLNSFLPKSMERLIESHVRKVAFRLHPLSEMQHAYQRGKSCGTALQNLVTRIKCALDRREYAMCVFLDIEGVFEKATFDCMCDSARQHGVDEPLVLWIKAMLMNITLVGDLD